VSEEQNQGEYFVFANSFAAPFVSDSSESYVSGASAIEALERFVANYKHPARLYFAAIWRSADDYHKSKPALAKWTCNHELELQRLTKGQAVVAYRSGKPGNMEVNQELHTVKHPFDGEFEVLNTPHPLAASG